jgi:hypothetical protein
LDPIRALGSDPDNSGIEALRVGKVRKVTECTLVMSKQLCLKGGACVQFDMYAEADAVKGPVTRVRVEMQVDITLDGQNKC